MATIIVEKPVEGRETKSGVIAVNANNSEYGSIMLSSTSFNMSGTFVNKQRRVGFITGRIADLEAFVANFKLTPGCDYSAKVGQPMKLVVKESTTPFFEGQVPKLNPTTGEQLVTKDGENIYRQVLVAPDNAETHDELIPHVTTVAAPATATATTEAARVLSEI